MNQKFLICKLRVMSKSTLIISINSSTISANLEGITSDTILFLVSKGNMPQYWLNAILSLFLWIGKTNKSFQCAASSSIFQTELISLWTLELTILVNNQLDELFQCIYFTSVHVWSIPVIIIRRINCVNTSSDIYHSV